MVTIEFPPSSPQKLKETELSKFGFRHWFDLARPEDNDILENGDPSNLIKVHLDLIESS